MTNGYVRLTWTNQYKDAQWYAWRVYRRLVTESAWKPMAEYTMDKSTYEFRDYLAKSTYTYEYAVVQVANRFGVLVESEYKPLPVNTVSNDYWFVYSNDPSDWERNFRIHHVTDDSYTEEFEEEEMLVVGAGRHFEFGERWGFKGTLTAQLWDKENLTAREQQLRFREFKEERTHCFLRTPFGDIWQVALSNISMTRTSGVGPREFGSITIPYSEVGG